MLCLIFLCFIIYFAAFGCLRASGSPHKLTLYRNFDDYFEERHK